MAKVKFGYVGQISQYSFGISRWNDSTVAIRISVDWRYLVRKLRLQDMLADCALDAVGASKNARFCDFSIGKRKDKFGWQQFDVDEALVELDMLSWNKAGHDIKQCLAMRLVPISNTRVNSDELEHKQTCARNQDGPTPTCRTMLGLCLQ